MGSQRNISFQKQHEYRYSVMQVAHKSVIKRKKMMEGNLKDKNERIL